jgi:hypothetical protein
VQRATDAVEASNEQLEGAKYQSVYDQQLSLWSLAAAEPEVAPYVVGGQEIPMLNAASSPKARQAYAQATAAVYATLDFYAYVYEQLAPSGTENGLDFVPLANTDQSPPKGMQLSQDEWNGWISWSTTIQGGLAQSPSACDHLLDQSSEAYTSDFREAVKASGACGD